MIMLSMICIRHLLFWSLDILKISLEIIKSCLVNWICNAVIGAAYPPINDAIGGAGMIT